jgi:hypothetical protein
LGQLGHPLLFNKHFGGKKELTKYSLTHIKRLYKCFNAKKSSKKKENIQGRKLIREESSILRKKES